MDNNLILKPYPNEHAARLHDPSDFKQDTFTRTHGGKWVLLGAGLIEVPRSIDVISGQLKTQTESERTAQALRFPIDTWNKQEAKTWLKEHKINYMTFEAATSGKERNFNLYNFKSFDAKIQDIDENSRQVKMYLSAFGNLDSDNDIILKGAFAKSLLERGVDSTSNRKIAYLRQHDWNKQIGTFVDLKEDNYGLMAIGKLGRSTFGNDALLDYQDGIIKEHSIGFRYIKDKIEEIKIDGQTAYHIKELDLWEGSAVTFGANSETFVIDVAKGLTKESYLSSLNEEMNILLGALKNGKGTDERLYNIEMGLKVIQSKYNSLVSYEPTNVKVCTHCKSESEPDQKPTLDEEQEKKKKVLINLINKKNVF